MSVPLKLTNSLGRDFLGQIDFQFNPTTGSVEPSVDKQKFYAWMRSLVVCAGLSRLAYSPTDVFCRGLSMLEYAPDVINDAISVLEYNIFSDIADGIITDQESYDTKALYNNLKYQAKFNVPSSQLPTKMGEFFPKSGCYVVVYNDILYVVFKGSSAFKDFVNDMKSIISISIKDNLPFCQEADPQATVGKGFWDHMKEETTAIIELILSLKDTAKRIVITGHSLGGAMASIMSLILGKKFKADGLKTPISCVSFGAPFVFSPAGRNYFNELLIDGILTLDRVTAFSTGLKKMFGATPGSGADIITSLPLPLVHPGFTTLKTEIYPAARTGRAWRVNEVRKVMIGDSAKGMFSKLLGSGVGELPDDMEFWNGFKKLYDQLGWKTAKEFKGYITKGANSVRRTDPAFLKVLYPDAKDPKNEAMPAAATNQAEEPDPTLVAAVDAASKIAPEETEGDAAPQTGGAITFALSNSAAKYKKETLFMAPNRLNFQCSNRLSSNFCHGAYMGIGFMGALRLFPVVRLGKMPVQRKEPTVRLIISFVNEINRYISGVGISTGGGKKTRRRRRSTRKRCSKTRK